MRANSHVFALSFNAMFAKRHTANGNSDYVQSQLYADLCDFLQKKLDPASYRLMLFAEVYYDEKNKKCYGVLRNKNRENSYYDFDEFRKNLAGRAYSLVCYTYLDSGAIKIIDEAGMDFSTLHLITDLADLADRLVTEQGVLPSNVYLLQAGQVTLSDMGRIETSIAGSMSSTVEIYLDVDATLVNGIEFTAFMTEQLVRIDKLCREKFSDLRYVIITARANDTFCRSTQTILTVRDVCLELMALTGCDIPPENIIYTNGRFDKGEFIERDACFRLFFDDQGVCLDSMASKVTAAAQVHPFGFSTEAWDRLARNLVSSIIDLSASRYSVFSPSTATSIDDDFADLGKNFGSGEMAEQQRVFTFYSGPKK